ncbi:hypothetical protein E1B28_013701 [Marasmius oreades]|uniref:NmrA-like domain-containing protein n=1 Tax=Marasmius oreades TaxID=181124 RepID=A0A9P7RR39_9AGAR|nr:uncharacterized protein E1B28_013701 [Marasmius oreades]KAG7087760.1 hypothetical protein E1B28_013701 [Marasmius oreades]
MTTALKSPLPLPSLIRECLDWKALIISGDVVNDTEETLEGYLKTNNVDVVVLTTIPLQPGEQNKIILAAKKADVKRVVPSDFGPWLGWKIEGRTSEIDVISNRVFPQQSRSVNCLPPTLGAEGWGIRMEIPYTRVHQNPWNPLHLIHIGTWVYMLFPAPHSAKDHLQMVFYGSGSVKTAYTALERGVEEFVKRIITDDRTLNKAVMTYDGECMLTAAWKVGDELCGEKFGESGLCEALKRRNGI